MVATATTSYDVPAPGRWWTVTFKAVRVGLMQRISYGPDPSQYGVLHLPDGVPIGVVVVIHGGFWKAQYDASLGEPLARDLAERGWAAWNIEYRRVGNGGGTPETFEDVSEAIDLLADLDVPLHTVVTVGHSAGGHLAVWAAGRTAMRVEVTAAISQGGVLDLQAAADADLGGGAVRALLGDEEPDANWDPLTQAPLDVPVICVHGTHDDEVPVGQSRSYVDVSPRARLVEYDGGHYEHLDTASEAWRLTLEALDRVSQPS